MNAHSAMLTGMRLPDQSFALDASAMSRNPIIQRRKAPDQGYDRNLICFSDAMLNHNLNLPLVFLPLLLLSLPLHAPPGMWGRLSGLPSSNSLRFHPKICYLQRLFCYDPCCIQSLLGLIYTNMFSNEYPINSFFCLPSTWHRQSLSEDAKI